MTQPNALTVEQARAIDREAEQRLGRDRAFRWRADLRQQLVDQLLLARRGLPWLRP